MRFQGQRWRYRIGNTLVHVDNAFSWTGWAQERLIVNGETVQQAGGWFGIRRAFDEPWLTPIDEDELRIRLRSRLWSVSCEAELSGEPVVPEALFETAWTGAKGGWPGEHAWVETDAFTWRSR